MTAFSHLARKPGTAFPFSWFACKSLIKNTTDIIIVKNSGIDSFSRKQPRVLFLKKTYRINKGGTP